MFIGTDVPISGSSCYVDFVDFVVFVFFVVVFHVVNGDDDSCCS